MSDKSSFAVEMWPIERPIDYPKNARKWSKHAIEKVATSIREFGWRQPVVVDSEGVIVIGHLRRAAGRSIGLTECPVHVARDLSPAKIRALRLADNRTAQEADWDLDILAAEFADLKTFDFDLSITGFDTYETDSLVPRGESKDIQAKYEEREKLREKWGTQTGQMWKIGKHRLWVGDNAALGVACDGVVSDPPYDATAEMIAATINRIAPVSLLMLSDRLASPGMSTPKHTGRNRVKITFRLLRPRTIMKSRHSATERRRKYSSA